MEETVEEEDSEEVKVIYDSTHDPTTVYQQGPTLEEALAQLLFSSQAQSTPPKECPSHPVRVVGMPAKLAWTRR